jgi:hypothetical protein
MANPAARRQAQIKSKMARTPLAPLQLPMKRRLELRPLDLPEP